MIIRIVKMSFRQECIEDFKRLFESVYPVISSFDGCRSVSLLQDVANPHIMMTYSIWENEAALNHYRYSTFFKQTWISTKALFAERAEALSLRNIHP
jgi:hypothetical protein